MTRFEPTVGGQQASVVGFWPFFANFGYFRAKKFSKVAKCPIAKVP
ncbi:MAG: hypothetical protein GY755_10520 [Chloroflexi bacterium]|nr:hypothetical protein [Chloroflexota bacterium]